MDCREALLLAERLKVGADPDVLTLCEFVHETDEPTAALEPTQERSSSPAQIPPCDPVAEAKLPTCRC